MDGWGATVEWELWLRKTLAGREYSDSHSITNDETSNIRIYPVCRVHTSLTQESSLLLSIATGYDIWRSICNIG